MEHPKSEGRLFANRDKEADKHPDFKGYATLTKAQINRLVEMGKAGIEPRLQIAAWDRVAKSSGEQYIYLATEVYMKEDAGYDEPPPRRATRPEPPPRRPARPAPPPAQAQEEGWDDDLPF
jgi:hypothetical protein